MTQIPHLNKLNSKYGKKGLAVVGVTDESASKIKDFIANKKKIEYMVGLGRATEYKARGIPAAWLIGANGKVLWKGHPSGLKESAIEEALKSVSAAPTLEDLPRSLAKANAYLNAGKVGSAIKFLKTKTKSKGAVGEKATAGLEKLEAYGASLLAQADKHAEAGDWDDAVSTLDKAQAQFKYHDVAKQAKAKETEWRKDKTKRLELEAADLVLKAIKYENAGSKAGAVAYLRKVTKPKKFEGTAMRKKAETMLQALSR